jgi:hypothetical protein
VSLTILFFQKQPQDVIGKIFNFTTHQPSCFYFIQQTPFSI